jgi:hypothetical protein
MDAQSLPRSSSTNAASRLLAKIKVATTDPIPRGFKTAEEWATEWAVSAQRAREYLRIATGTTPPLMVVERLRVIDPSGRAGSVPHYAESKYAVTAPEVKPEKTKKECVKKKRR